MALAANNLTTRAPRSAGALFLAIARLAAAAMLVLAWLLASACREKHTPDWHAASQPPVAQPELAPPSRPPPRAAHPPAATSGELRLVAYNLQNYLRMERLKDGMVVPDAPKPEASIAALVRILVDLRPNVLGVAEIGTPEDARDLQRRLAAAGLDLPHLEFTHGSDPVRRQALFSAWPITTRQSVTTRTFVIHGQRSALLRGFLDVTIDFHGTPVRFVGAHLKSRRDVPDYDQQLQRHAEAQLLRDHLDKIFQADPQAAVVVYGDFNDTPQSPTLRTITGPRNQPGALDPLDLTDAHGLRWTHFWASEESYSRIDYICLSPSLAHRADRSASRVAHPANWQAASDHRPLLLVLR